MLSKHCNLWTALSESFQKLLTRARVAVSATFAMVGDQNDPPLTQKLGKLENRAIRRSTALSEPVRSHFGHFFAQMNIEVSRGHQRSNFRKMMVLSGMPAIISGTIIATPNPKKQKIALETLSLRWRKISPKINRLSVRSEVTKDQKRHFWAKQFSNDNFCV